MVLIKGVIRLLTIFVRFLKLSNKKSVNKYLLNFIQDFIAKEDQKNISDFFAKILPPFVFLFLIEQLIVAYFDTFNNFVVTAVALVFYSVFLVMIKRNHLINIKRLKFYIYVITLGCIILWWFSSEGLLGSIGYYFSFSVFCCIAMFDAKEYRFLVYFPIIIFSLLSLMDIFYPGIPLKYSSEIIKKIDIFSAMLFSSLMVIAGFLFIKILYEEKQKELIAQYKEEKELNEELDNFVYRTSHDLRAPISSCIGLADIALNANNTEEIYRYIELQKVSLNRMDKFISDVLSYSRNKRMDSVLQRINIEDVFNSVIEQLSYMPDLGRIQFIFENKTDKTFKSDPLRLQMIFNNLISNSVRYKDSQKQNSYVKVTSDFQNGEWVIVFEDNGIGINEESLPRIFEMFYRGTQKSDGSGVGLYIVKQALQKINGTIECKSRVNQGTTFTVRIPG